MLVRAWALGSRLNRIEHSTAQQMEEKVEQLDTSQAQVRKGNSLLLDWASDGPLRLLYVIQHPSEDKKMPSNATRRETKSGKEKYWVDIKTHHTIPFFLEETMEIVSWIVVVNSLSQISYSSS